MLIKGGKVLITQNGEDSDHPYQWEFPGGKVKASESDKACIEREIMEELELHVDIIEALFPIEHDYGFKKIRLIPFVCRIKSGTLKLNNHINKKWIEITALKNEDLSEADKRLIELERNKEFLKKYIRE